MEESQWLNGNSGTTLEESLHNSKSYQESPDLTSNAIFDYINQLLLEEEMNEKELSYQDERTLQATEKSFYDILGQNCPSSFDGSTQSQQSSIVCDSPKQNDGSVSRPCQTNDSPTLKHPVFDLTSTIPLEIPSVWQVQKGAEESVKLLPNIDKLFIDLEPDQYRLIQKTQDVGSSIKKKESSNNPRSKKKSSGSDNDLLEGRHQKQIAVYSDVPD